MPPKLRFTREDVFEAAFCVVRKHGWKGLSARSIAQELNSSIQPIYSHVKSIRNLDEEIVRKAYELMRDYGSKVRTRDIWLDQGIGYVLFAKKEKRLFRSLMDERSAPFRKNIRRKSLALTGDKLSNYPPFQGLTKEQRDKIRWIRIIFLYGLATDISASVTILSEKRITDLIRQIDKILLTGFKVGLKEDKAVYNFPMYKASIGMGRM